MDNRKTSHFCEYLKNSIYFCIRTKIIFFFLALLEYVDLITNLIDQLIRLFYSGKIFNINDNKLSKHFLIISPYNYFFNFLSDSAKIDAYLTYNFYIIIFYLVLIIHFIIFFFSLPKYHYNILTNINDNIYFKLVVNFYDYIFHRPLAIYAFDIFCREIMKLLFINEFSISEYLLLFVYFLILIIIYIWHVIYIKKVNIWTNFITYDSCISNYPFDNFYGSKYDLTLLTIKLFISINKNYEFYNGNKIDYIVLFNIFLILVIFYGYSIYLYYVFLFSNKCLYIFKNCFNGMRTYNVLLLFETIPLRIIFHNDIDYTSFLAFFILFILFDLYLIINRFSDFLISKGIKCQNYLKVGYFVCSNKLDINAFITQWIINHKSECNNEKCPICLELEKYDILNNEEDEEKKIGNMTVVNEEINIKKLNGNKNRLNESNINTINKIFSPYIFTLKLLELLQNYKNDFNYEDSLRYDILYLTSLFLSSQKIDFLLYSELYLLMSKYEDNKNIVVTLRLVYNLSRSTHQEEIKNFDLLKKNDILLQTLKTFMNDYENFVNYSSKSPENYLAMSVKFKNFKETVKNLHTIFKKNLERNYQLIIMRFAYDSLLHQKFKNEPNFDFSIYNEFLIDRFEKDKIMLIKYTIDKDNFTIIKCSKDFIKYEGNNLENIFPEFLKKVNVDKFILQLKNMDQRSFNQIFECIIKSSNDINKDNFIEAFKMEFCIYLTFNINEIYIFGRKYTIGYTDYIIYEQRNDKSDIIFSFSYKIYKYLGITPEMVYLLRKMGMFIECDKIFIKKDNENEFILKYSNYYPYYENIIKNEALLDLPDYSTVVEKQRELKSMSKEDREVIFIISLKEECKTNIGNFNIYNIKEKIKKVDKRKSLNVKEKDEDSDEMSYDASGERENEFNNQSLNAMSAEMGSSISASSYKDTSQVIGSNKGKQNDKNYERIKSLKTINKFTIIILIFDIFLIILSIIFLILEVKEYNYFKEVFDLFQTFKVFKRGVESSPLSLFLNYKYIYNINNLTNEVSSINIYETYSNNLRQDYPIMNSFPKVYEFIQWEIHAKYFSIIKSFNNYLTVLFNIRNDASQRVQNLLSFSLSLQKEENLALILNYENFISLCREYNNFLSNILLDNIYLKQNISILNMESINELNYILDSQFDFEFSSTIKNMLLFMFSYPSIHIGLAESSYFMQQEFHSSNNFMEKLLIIFFVLFMSLHIILIIICICFFKIYLKLLKINIVSTNKLFMDKKYIKFQTKRLELIKIITTLYSSNPVNLFEKIKALEEEYKRKTHQENKPKKNEYKNLLYEENNINTPLEENKKERESSKSNNFMNGSLKNVNVAVQNDIKKANEDNNSKEKQDNNQTNENNDEDDENSPLIMKNYTISPGLFQKIIVNYKYILVYLFSLYFLYCIIFFIFVMFGINRVYHAISYCEVNNNIDELVYDNLNSLAFMYLTNSTPFFYNNLIYGNDTKNYIEIGINKLYSNLQEKENIEHSYSNLFPPLNLITNLDCSKPYIQDENFITAAEQLNVNYDDYIKALCEAFPVAKTNNDNNILYEILYMTEEFYRNFKTESFEYIFENYFKNPLLCECFTLLLTFNKIIRTYFNDAIFPGEVYSIFRYFSSLIIAYLVVSVLFEIIFFIVLNITILQKIKYNNELMLDFIDSLKF